MASFMPGACSVGSVESLTLIISLQIEKEDCSVHSTQIGGRHFDLKLNALLTSKREDVLRVNCVKAACAVANCHHQTLERRMRCTLWTAV